MKRIYALMAGFACLIGTSSGFASPMTKADAQSLMSAARYRDFQTLRESLARGANINYRDEQGNTLYCLAVKNNDQQTASVLKSFGGTSDGCPGIDPNYRPPRKVVYEEKSGIFAGSKVGDYLLMGGGVAVVALLVGGGGGSDTSSAGGARSPVFGDTTNPGNSVQLTVPVALDTVTDPSVYNTTDEFNFTSRRGTGVESHWSQIGLDQAFAYGYDGRLVDRDTSGGLIGTYTTGVVKVAIVDTGGVDVFHSDFDSTESEAAYENGELYDYSAGVNYLANGAVGLAEDIGLPGPFFVGQDTGGDTYLDTIDHFATQAGGIISADNNNDGIVGIAPESEVRSYIIGAGPFEAMDQAMDHGADVIMFNAVRNLFDIEFNSEGDPIPVFDSAYTAGNLAAAADQESYFLNQISIAYDDQPLVTQPIRQQAANLYDTNFNALTDDEKPIFVVSTGNDAQVAETNVEAAPPMAFPELLGNFIAVTGVDQDNELYTLQYSPIGTNSTLTFGSNGCGLTEDWCLAAPADEIMTLAGGTGDMLDWNQFLTDTTALDNFLNLTNDFDGAGSSECFDGACTMGNENGIPTQISTGTATITTQNYNDGSRLVTTDFDPTSDYTAVYSYRNEWTPIDGGDYFRYFDLDASGDFNGGDLDVVVNGTPFQATDTPDYIARWVDSGLNPTGEWEISLDGLTWITPAGGETIEKYFIDDNMNGIIDEGEFVSDDGIVTGATPLVWDIVNDNWEAPTDVSWQEVFYLTDDGAVSQTSGISDLNDMYAPLDFLVQDINGDGLIVGQSRSLTDTDFSDFAFQNLGTGVWDEDFGNLTWGTGIDEDLTQEIFEFYDFYFIDSDDNGQYTPGDILYIPMIGSAAATAVVAGGVALISSAFPHMTNEEIVALLFATATDLGDSGVDTTYGHGLMNLALAMQPLGTVNVPINWTSANWSGAYSPPSSGVARSARGGISVAQSRMRMGQAFGNAVTQLNGLSFVGLDEFNRGFTFQMNRFVDTASTLPSLLELSRDFGTRKKVEQQITENLTFAFSTRTASENEFSQELPVNMQFSFQEDGRTIAAAVGEIGYNFYQEEGGESGAFLNKELVYNPYLSLIDDEAVSMKYAVSLGDAWTLASISSYGQNRYEDGIEDDNYSMISQVQQEQYTGHVAVSMMRLTKGMFENTLSFGLETGVSYEEKTILGAVNEGAFQTQNGTRTHFYSLNFAAQPFEKVSLFAGYTQGISQVEASHLSFFQDMSDIRTSSFHVTANYAMTGKTSFGLTVAQPLRVESAQANLYIPVARDPVQNLLYHQNTSVNLTPTDRETDVQAFMTYQGDHVVFDTGILHQFNPGHSSYLQDDTTFLMKLKFTLK